MLAKYYGFCNSKIKQFFRSSLLIHIFVSCLRVTHFELCHSRIRRFHQISGEKTLVPCLVLIPGIFPVTFLLYIPVVLIPSIFWMTFLTSFLMCMISLYEDYFSYQFNWVLHFSVESINLKTNSIF